MKQVGFAKCNVNKASNAIWQEITSAKLKLKMSVLFCPDLLNKSSTIDGQTVKEWKI